MTSLSDLPAAGPSALKRTLRIFTSSPVATIASAVLLLLALAAIFAPLLAPHDPMRLVPSMRLKPPSDVYLLGTDAYGRDLFSRIIHGARVSLIIGVGAAVAATAVGLAVGLLAGFFRRLDAVLMRVVDGLMAIPNILLAIAIVSLSGASLMTVLVAITIPEVPRVVRLVRSVVLMLRDQLYVQAAIACGTSTPRILIRHILPNTIPPLIVQATYICAQAVIFEAYLSFVGAGTPPEIPSWGNIMAEGRMFFFQTAGIILYPGAFLALTVFAINTFGDGLRDALDPRMQRRV